MNVTEYEWFRWLMGRFLWARLMWIKRNKRHLRQHYWRPKSIDILASKGRDTNGYYNPSSLQYLAAAKVKKELCAFAQNRYWRCFSSNPYKSGDVFIFLSHWRCMLQDSDFEIIFELTKDLRFNQSS